MTSLLELAGIGFMVGLFQAMSNALFTWIANKTLIKKLNQIEKELKRRGKT